MAREKVSIRRAPRIWSFIFTGAIIGVICSLIITNWFPVDPAVGFWSTLGFFSVFGVAIGGILGGGVGLVADVGSFSRQIKGEANVTVVNPKKKS